MSFSFRKTTLPMHVLARQSDVLTLLCTLCMHLSDIASSLQARTTLNPGLVGDDCSK